MTTYQISEQERSLLAAGALAGDLGPTPRLLTTLTDEELLALTGPDRPVNRLPWLDGLRERVPGYGLEEAVLAGARSLRARGITAPEAALAAIESRDRIGDGSAVRAGLVVTGVIARRAAARRRLVLSRESDPHGLSVGFHVDSDGTVLQEQVSGEGLHHFLIQDLSSALRALHSLLEDDEDTGGSEGADQGEERSLVSGPWHQVSAVLGIADRSTVTRLDLVDQAAEASETLWIARSVEGPVVLRAAEWDEAGAAPDGTALDGAALEGAALEATPLSAPERDELLEEILSGGRAAG